MKLLRFIWRLVWVVLWLILGLACIGLVFPVLPAVRRTQIIHYWSRGLVRLCGVRVRVQGQPIRTGPILYVANHISWLDIFVLNSVRATGFVAKQDIRDWPILGWLVAGAGTVFIDRTQRHAIKGVSLQMQQRFARNEAVGVFPEGTTSEGLDVSAFHASLFEPAIRVNVGVQPIALRFYEQRQRSTRLAFVGEQSLVENLWLLLSATHVSVAIDFLGPLSAQTCQSLGRAEVAQQTRQRIRECVTAPDR